MLIGNITTASRFPGRFLGGSTLSGERSNFNRSGSARNQYTAFDAKCATPNGYSPPYSWIIAKSAGGIASYTQISGSGTMNSPNLQLIIDIGATITSQGLIFPLPVVQATIPISAAISGTGDFLSAPIIQALGNLSANITPFTGLTPDNIASGILDDSFVESGLTVRQAMRLISAALAGKISGAGTTTVTIRNAVVDSKDRIVATVDVDGNRTSITTDVT